jgi:hypothetical protein
VLLYWGTTQEALLVVNLPARSLPPVVVHLETPSAARLCDYYLGGTTNWVVDREFGDLVLERFPLVRRLALVNRLFLRRVVRYLRGMGVRQFLDVGAGVPAVGATHEIADELDIRRRCEPSAHVVYVDNDPLAVAHADVLLDSDGDPTRQTVIEADLRAPVDLWRRALDTELLDPDVPVGLLLVGVLHLRQVDASGNEIGPESVTLLHDQLPAGSYVAIADITFDGIPDHIAEMLVGIKRMYEDSGSCDLIWRSRADVAAMLGTLHMVKPGWTWATDWHKSGSDPEVTAAAIPSWRRVPVWSGVAEKRDGVDHI